MFVLKSTHTKAVEELNYKLDRKTKVLLDTFDEVSRLEKECKRLSSILETYKIYLDDAVLAARKNQFTQEEIQTLISLCHPDKHNGKESANNITVKLLKLRKEMK